MPQRIEDSDFIVELNKLLEQSGNGGSVAITLKRCMSVGGMYISLNIRWWWLFRP